MDFSFLSFAWKAPHGRTLISLRLGQMPEHTYTPTQHTTIHLVSQDLILSSDHCKDLSHLLRSYIRKSFKQTTETSWGPSIVLDREQSIFGHFGEVASGQLAFFKTLLVSCAFLKTQLHQQSIQWMFDWGSGQKIIWRVRNVEPMGRGGLNAMVSARSQGLVPLNRPRSRL